MRPPLPLLLPALLLSACTPMATPTPPASAQVRALHAAADVPPVDILVDGTAVAPNLSFKSATPYVSAPAGNRTLAVNLAGTATTALQVTPNLAANHRYTAIAAGTVADRNVTALLFDDTTADPQAGRVKLRLIHAASQAPNVDIYVTAPGASLSAATPTLTNVAYRQASDYLEVPAGTYQVRITPTGSKTVVIDTGDVTLQAGQIRTGVALNPDGPGGAFQATLLADKN